MLYIHVYVYIYIYIVLKFRSWYDFLLVTIFIFSSIFFEDVGRVSQHPCVNNQSITCAMIDGFRTTYIYCLALYITPYAIHTALIVSEISGCHRQHPVDFFLFMGHKLTEQLVTHPSETPNTCVCQGKERNWQKVVVYICLNLLLNWSFFTSCP